MNQISTANPPATLLLSLQPPARLRLGTSNWNLNAQFFIGGLPVEGNDTPFFALADLLIDADRRWFAGLTWPIFDAKYREPMRRIAQRLDPQVVRYNDLSDPNATRSYPTPPSGPHWFEIIWSPSKNLKYECAQLCNGQWFWWYENEKELAADSGSGQSPSKYVMTGSWAGCPPVVAVGLADIPDVLKDMGLEFPTGMKFPHLDFSVR